MHSHYTEVSTIIAHRVQYYGWYGIKDYFYSETQTGLGYFTSSTGTLYMSTLQSFPQKIYLFVNAQAREISVNALAFSDNPSRCLKSIYISWEKRFF